MQNKTQLMGFATNKLLAWVVLGLLGTLTLTGQAQDTLHLKSGQKIDGEVMSQLPDGSINFKFAQGTIPYRRDSIDKIVLGEREEFKQALAASETGKYDVVITKLQPLMDKFLGIDSLWVAQAAGELANALRQTGKTFESDKLSERVVKLYPDSPVRLSGPINKAETLLIRDKVDEAIAALESVKDQLPVKPSPNASEMQLLGDYHFAMGMAMEKKGDKETALEHYLTVSAVYPKPAKRAQEADQKADALVKANAGLSVP
jgi:tetratricopeptide (TPR) repeat protein